MWMSNSHATAYYWSHAGQHFEIRDEGDWWVAVPDEEWPEAKEQRDVVVQVRKAGTGSSMASTCERRGLRGVPYGIGSRACLPSGELAGRRAAR